MASFMPGEWDILRGGGNLGGLLGGGNLGGLLGNPYALGADLLGGALGIQSNPLGLAGGLLGSFAGPVGGALGGLLGNVVGGIFGLGNKKPSRPRSSYYYDFNTDSTWLNQSKALDEDTKDVLRGIVSGIGSTAESTLGLLGLEPTVPGFSFGQFQGRSGFLLPDDPFVTDLGKGASAPGKEYYGPNVWQAIGPNRYSPDLQGTRAFGDYGDRTGFPTAESLLAASGTALDEIVRRSISDAGLTNAQVFERLGLPSQQDAYRPLLGDQFQFGELDFSAPSVFTYKDILAAEQLKGLLSGLPAAPAAPLSPLLGTRPFWETGQIPAPFWARA
jgi:hypothetical protein